MSKLQVEFEYAEEDEFALERNPDVIWVLAAGEKVGYIQFYLFDDQDDLFEEIDPERYGWTLEGPFLHADEESGSICYLANINVLEAHRGSGVYPLLVRQLEQMGFPVYACFTNGRLAARWRSQHAA